MAFVEEDHPRLRFAGEVEILLGFFDNDSIIRAPLGLGHIAGSAVTISISTGKRKTRVPSSVP